MRALRLRLPSGGLDTRLLRGCRWVQLPACSLKGGAVRGPLGPVLRSGLQKCCCAAGSARRFSVVRRAVAFYFYLSSSVSSPVAHRRLLCLLLLLLLLSRLHQHRPHCFIDFPFLFRYRYRYNQFLIRRSTLLKGAEWPVPPCDPRFFVSESAGVAV